MLNPVVLPLPLALMVLAALTVACRTWLERVDTMTLQPTTPARGRHRIAAVTDAYRPRTWTEIAAELAAERAARAERWSPDELDAALDLAEMSATEKRWAAGDTHVLAVVA